MVSLVVSLRQLLPWAQSSMNVTMLVYGKISMILSWKPIGLYNQECMIVLTGLTLCIALMCVGLWKTTAKTWWDRPCKRSAQSADVHQHVQGSLCAQDHTHTCILDSGKPWLRCWGLWSGEGVPTSIVVASSAWCWLVGLGSGCPG